MPSSCTHCITELVLIYLEDVAYLPISLFFALTGPDSLRLCPGTHPSSFYSAVACVVAHAGHQELISMTGNIF